MISLVPLPLTLSDSTLNRHLTITPTVFIGNPHYNDSTTILIALPLYTSFMCLQYHYYHWCHIHSHQHHPHSCNTIYIVSVSSIFPVIHNYLWKYIYLYNSTNITPTMIHSHKQHKLLCLYNYHHSWITSNLIIVPAIIFQCHQWFPLGHHHYNCYLTTATIISIFYLPPFSPLFLCWSAFSTTTPAPLLLMPSQLPLVWPNYHNFYSTMNLLPFPYLHYYRCKKTFSTSPYQLWIP